PEFQTRIGFNMNYQYKIIGNLNPGEYRDVVKGVTCAEPETIVVVADADFPDEEDEWHEANNIKTTSFECLHIETSPGGSPLLVATVKPYDIKTQEGGGRQQKMEAADFSGFANLVIRNSTPFLVGMGILASAWFFYDRRRNIRMARLKTRGRR
ncbi:MAG: hypothetical protein V1787_00205, partial [Candidatus Micrarchaeota archaeon]